jgi:hypothetical protein
MIVEHISRDRHPKDLHQVLRYGDLEGIMPAGGGRERVYLSAHFLGEVADGVPAHRQSIRPGRRKAGLPDKATYFQLCRLHHHTDASRVVPPEGKPWQADAAPAVVFAEVQPIARKVSVWFPMLRQAIVDVLAAEVAGLVGDGYGSRWQIHVALLPESAELEIGVTTWTDLLRNDEKIRRVALP